MNFVTMQSDKKYNVILNYFNSPHLNQIYDGFAKLQKLGICEVQYIFDKNCKGGKPLVFAEINGVKVLYDCLDGLNWRDDLTHDENLDYFAQHDFSVDYYFKRSYSLQLESLVNNRFQYLPLGLNYDIYPEYMPLRFSRLKQNLLRTKLGIKWRGDKLFFLSEEFEQHPVIHLDGGILFLARLWNPVHCCDEKLREERLRINQTRIESIRKCRDAFGDMFLGGIQTDEYSLNHCPKELLVSNAITNRANYLRLMQSSNICIATTGLYDSIGWKFGEYVAASRAIVSEPLNYELPGDFTEGKNYLSFTTSNDLLNKISSLLSNRVALKEMMIANKNYYENYLKPDNLVLNTLKKIPEI